MNQLDPTQTSKASLADFFAEERTFLAWIRTALALMGFGFVVARFGLFLQELQTMQHIFVPQSHLLSLWFGIALIVLGVAVNLYAALRHVQFIGQLNSGETAYPRPSKRAALLALLLALIGLAMAFYLTFLRTLHRPASSNPARRKLGPSNFRQFEQRSHPCHRQRQHPPAAELSAFPATTRSMQPLKSSRPCFRQKM